MLEGGGAEETVRPGCEKLSWEDSFPQRFPMMNGNMAKRRRGERDVTGWIGVMGGSGAKWEVWSRLSSH